MYIQAIFSPAGALKFRTFEKPSMFINEVPIPWPEKALKISAAAKLEKSMTNLVI